MSYAPEEIVNLAADLYGFEVQQIYGYGQHRPLLQVRQATIWVTRMATSLSYPKLGKIFGGRDHTTVMNSCRRAIEDEEIATIALDLLHHLGARRKTRLAYNPPVGYQAPLGRLAESLRLPRS